MKDSITRKENTLEAGLLLETWNATETPYPDHLCIHQLFEQQAEKTPAAAALIAGDKTLSYAELNARANRLACQLIEQGVYPDDHVAILLERSVELVVAQLAILKTGAIYVPVDPNVPNERKSWLINDCAAKLLLTDMQTEIPVDLVVPRLRLTPETEPIQEEEHHNLDLLGASAGPAYIMYTSGSTGTPKGVIVPHRAVVRLVINNGYAEIEPNDRIAFATNPAFDASTFEVWAPLLNGAALVVIDHTTLLTPRDFVQALQAHRITVLWMSVGLFNRLAAELSPVLPQLKMLLVGGDVLDPHVIAQVLRKNPPQKLLNAYGPSEGTTFTTTYRIDALTSGTASIPIGRPIANTRLYLLDTDGQPVSLGMTGEIYVGGDGVACGYLNRPELTAERFLTDPFSDKPNARMYRTGDLARYLPDGNLAFLGRNDQQVKIRGFRIEPGEIEARLVEYPAIREAVVLALGEGQDKQLVAYVLTQENDGLAARLREHLSARLPDYMVPVAFVRLDEFPLTSNGKLDRRALPAPGEDAFARQVYATPLGEMEIVLATLWSELLGIERISRHDSFFALGGHSLLGVRMIERLRSLGLTLAARNLFQSPVLSELAQTLEQHQAIVVPPNIITLATTALTPEMLPLIDLTQPEIDHIVEQVPGGIANVQDIYALSPLQDGILFHHLLAKEGDPYLLAYPMIFADRALLDRYLAAMQQVVDRHDILRTAFIWQELSAPAQVVWRQAPLSVTELTLDPADGPVGEQLAHRFDPRQYRFDLSQAPLLRFVVAQETDGRWHVLQLQHHLIGDHTTMEVMHREVQVCLAGQDDNLPAPAPFRNLVAQARLDINQAEHTRFFTDMLADVDEPTLPFGLTEVHRDGSQVTQSHRILSPALNDRLRQQAKRLGVSVATLCHLAWAQVLSQTSGQEKVVFGTVLFGRMAAGEGADSGMGLFINTLPLRLDMDDTPVHDSVRLAQSRLAGLLDYEHASLALAQRCSGVAGGTPLFSALLNYRHNEQPLIPHEAVPGIEFLGEQERTNYPFVLSVEDGGSTLGLTAQVVQPFEPDRVCGYMQQALASLAEALERVPETPVRALNILPETERALLLETWNATETPYPEQLCIHQLIEQQVEKTPDATALVYEGQTLSYAELNADANRLAHQLIALGITPDQRVAVCMASSPARVVGLLAVLKAGGAYVPLDPVYPGERLAHILNDAAPSIVLADETGRLALGEEALAGLTLLDPNTLPDQPDSNPQVPALTSRHLAYVIYTSGSTGVPKGVMVEHRGVVNLIRDKIVQFGIHSGNRVLQFASFGFDASVWETMMALTGGAGLAIPVDTVRQDPHRLWHYLEEQAVTHACLTPALLRDGADLPALTIKPTVILGGEAPSPALLQTLSRQATLFNAYGPTEITVCATHWRCPSNYTDALVPIGRPTANTRIYLLDDYGQPVPLGAVGELYIGGAGVTRGYLNRPELTAERFLTDPFSDDVDARMYRTGDLARYLPDGNLVFVGRNDQQVKIRGFRIEPGEIEARLTEYSAVREAWVLARGDGRDKRLVAYVVAEKDSGLAARLREHLSAILPDYMVPAAFVRLDAFPLTPNGKLDRQALPVPDQNAFARQVYQAPQGEIETALATIWSELLEVEQISRHDSFFALGGHSLLAVRMIEHLRRRGLGVSVQTLFEHPTLSVLAQSLAQHCEIRVPDNRITPDTIALTPEMLPLIELTQPEIDRIVEQVPGGIANIQDIYALSPLQDGILFHHLLANEGDPYLLIIQQAFADRSLLDRYLAAVQQVVDRHDILRTAFIWKGLSTPAQVVCRQVPLFITELTLNPTDGSISDQLAQRFDPRRYRIDLSQAPLLRFVIAQDTDGRWILLQLLHHLIGDHTTLEVMNSEVQAYLTGRGDNLPASTPFRHLVAQARLGTGQSEHTRFFTDMLAAVDEPTLPFGLTEVHHDGSQVTESHRMLTPALNNRLRNQARRLGVSLAALCHLAWAQVLSRTSGQEKVVFGTVLFGRMQSGEGADSGMGLFINTLPLRLDMDETPVWESVRAVHTRLAELLAHEHASLALAQRCSGVARGTPLFNALLNYRHNTQPVTPGEIISGIEFLGAQERTNYPFVLSVEDGGSTLGLTAQVVQPFESERVCGYMQQALESLAEALEQRPETPVRLLNILPEAEKQLLLATWNATQTPYPDQCCIHRLFEQQAEKTPDAIALVYGEHIFSYVELNARANRLAHWLIEQGIQSDDRVAVLLERSAELVVAQLAILKAGAVYVPIDPRVPDERKHWLINDCSAKLLLTDIPVDLAIPLFCLVDEMGAIREEDHRNPDLPRSSTELAYIMYTSGSTGIPKGVMVPHCAVVRLVINTGYAEIGPDDRVSFTANPAFDASMFEVWAPLLNGGALVVIDYETVLTPHKLVQVLQVHHVTVLWLTIGLFNRLAAELSPVLPQIKILIFGGDIPDLHVIAQVLDNHPPQQLLQAYGPSEGTTFTTMYPITALPQGVTRIPIGRPIANTRVYLLDTAGQPVPLGAAGEIYIGGDGVACGYLNRPELTAERFLADPFSGEPGARMYRTGDLARYLPDGNLEFLGRNDQQVKIRGFRIEPGEIEARLMEHPVVHEAVVLVLGDGQDKRLVAYVVAEADEALVNHLRTYLSAILPDYMVPAAFVRLDIFPLTSNGKLDRRALPAPEEEAFARQVYEAPQGETETTLAAIWRELLGVERISRYDNFFALGGHSLLAVRMMNRIAALGIELPLSTLFKFPALMAFAEAIRARFIKPGRILPAIVPLSREGQLPLSFAQQRLWFLAQFDGVSDTYHIPLALRLHGQLDIVAWQQALNTLFARHEALRSVFVAVDGQPQVELLPAESGLPMKKYDLRDAPDVDAQLAFLSAQEVEASFDLARGPLIRSSLVQLADDDHVFLLTQHHIVSDGWSLGILKSELEALYAACLNQQPDPLLPLVIQYPDYAAWQRQWLSAERIQSQSDYWRTKLADAPVLLDLPTDRPRPPQQSFAGSIWPVSLDVELTQSLKRLSEQQGVTLFMTLLAAWATVLSRLSGQEDLIIGTPSAGRSRQEVESLIGFFVNTLALRMDLSDAPNMAELLARVRQTALAAQEHQDLPFEQVVEIVQPPRRPEHTPLFQVMFAWQESDTEEWQLPGLAVTPVVQGYDIAKFDLQLELTEKAGEVVGELNYSSALFDPETIERQVGYLLALLRAMVNHPQQSVTTMDILSSTERTLLLETWNATETPYPEQLCIHQLIEQQVEKTPDATALVYEGQTLSYAELNADANRLAHQLIALGIAPDQRVAVCMASSPARVVGLLAVLKAGGAYVPLDPVYPGERLAHILNDAAPSIVLADETGRLALGEEALAGLTLLDPNTLPDQPDSNPQVPALTSRHLAYVIYTSGSTGVPKGVMVEHRGVVNLIRDKIVQFGIHSGNRVLQFASFGFDASVWETMMALTGGAGLAIPVDTVRQDPHRLWHYLEEQAVTHACLTPALLRDGADLPALTIKPTVILGGEAPSPALLQTLSRQATLFNAYGPTEITVCATHWRCPSNYTDALVPIGRPTANTRIYLLDDYGQPVPLGAVGELYIGGAGVTRGYLNRPELTAERFLTDPFSDDVDARMYRTGDLARYLPDGNLVFVGRNDQQVKIRGFRIEPGEIEAHLTEHPAVSEAWVLALGDGQDKRLVAYVVANNVVAEADNGLAASLREHLSAILPDYMVPAAFVRLDAFPLTPNGKLDRQALPVPDQNAFARKVYQAPQGEIETALATIWSELLEVEQISRHDSFFALGGHSLLAVRMIEHLRRRGLGVSVQTLFEHPTLSVLAQSLAQHCEIRVPDNRITPDTIALTPEMLPLIELTQPEIDRIVEQVPGGIANIQDIYALSPLQDGILFHHLLANEGDPYLLIIQQAFADRSLLDRYLAAVQQVVDRHDILRTAFIWKGLSTPAQVVCRQVPLFITELTLNPTDGSISDQLAQRFDPRRHRIDLSQAPLLRFVIAQDTDGRWILLQLLHHLIGDHTTLEVMNSEVQAYLTGRGDNLPASTPFRHLVAQARLGTGQSEHTRFFTDMLAAVDEPTLPFGLTEVHHDGSQVTESHRMLTPALNNRLRNQARRLGVSLAALCHLAWAQVLSRTSGQKQVVFGTVLFGRMQAGEGADNGMGLFINTLPLRLDMDETPVRESVRAAHTRLAELLAHEHASLALAQRCSGVARGTPLFNALLNYRHNTQPVMPDEIISGIEFLGAQERTNYPFVLSVEDGGSDLGLTAQVVQPFDPERICGYMQQALESLAEALEQAPETPVQMLEILPETECTLLLKTWNATETSYPDQLCIHQLFEQQVENAPDATALVYENQSFSYAELNTRANRLAHQLIALGVAPDQRVAICVASSPARIVGLLAILKAGGAYVPLDPAYPGERLIHILTDAAPAILLADNTGRSALNEQMLAQQIVLDPNSLPDQPDNNPQVAALTSRHLAYVIYTSGSTGTPKGVMIEHQSVVNLTVEQIAQFDVGVTSRMLQFASFGFDASVWEIMMALCGGAALDIPADTVRQDPLRLWHYLEEQAVTHACLTPALLRDGADLPEITIRPTLILGGEAPSAALLQALRGRATLFNAYGPTEITVCATVWHCPSDYINGVISIGRPTANTRIYLLDAHGQPVPLGAVGELYIGGVGVARGYLNRPELTTERFLIDSFSEAVDARMYRTGDLARYLPDGNLVFAGRNDQQVKIRGFRIEPGEIEARLTEHPAVSEALVLARDAGQDKRLVAYVVAEPNNGLVADLREYLSAILPDYMVPAAFVRLDTFPLTPNGKLDRRALPVPGEEAFARQVYAAPQGEMEITLAAIWRELLGVERISRYDNFFALGGHSLLVVRMMNRIAALGIELPLTTLFKSPSLIAFAEVMRARFGEQSSRLPAIMPISREDKLPLSFAQQRLWFLAQFDRMGDTYHIPVALRLRGQLDIGVWQQALDVLFARHEALRSIFVAVDGQPQVELLPAESGLPMKKYDLRDAPDADAQLASLSAQEAETAFDLACGPLIRSSLVQLANDDHVFLLTQHHIVFDGWSVSVLMHELSTLYTAFLTGQPDPLPPLAIQYPDYAAWQRQWLSAERIQSQSDYWRTKLADAPVLLDLPTDRPRPPEQLFAGNILPISLDAQLTQSLKHLSEQQGVTLFMTLLAAWATVLSRLSGQEDLVIGTPSAGRSRQEVESLIGFFVNTLALRMDLSGAPNVVELLARTRQTALAAQEHQDLPFEQVVEIVQPPRRLAYTPLFQVMFAWQNNEAPEWALPGLAVSPVEQTFDVVKFDLELNLSEVDGRIVGYLNYATALFDQPTIERHLEYLHTVLREIVANPQQSVGKIDILAVGERKLLLETWNATETEYADQCCIHQLFEQQAEKTPDAIALMYEEHILSYAELNARANRLAHQLIELGIEPDQRVVICMTRSPSRVVGILAVLKAGGAYVPLDPAYPGERLTYMLRDSASSVILADHAGCLALGEEALAQLTVIDPNTCLDQPDNNLQIPILTSRHLAYVIYTSGSTGTPKGVMIEHQSVVNLTMEQIAQFDVGVTSRMLQFASFGFDASVWEIMIALSSGATLIIPTETIRQDPLRLWHYLEEQRVTHACMTPAMFHDGAGLPAIAIKPTLIFAGEAPATALFQTLCGRADLFNAYGPTEITVCATTWNCPSDYTGGLIPIGSPTVNKRVYLLDKHGQPVPLGAVGELYIGGVGVARGYLNRPELTAERFLPDPFSDDVDARMYRTEDLARYLPDGNLVFVGRNDQQVKIRGFRIEPGEIEAHLTEHPAVSEALVLALGDGQDKRLVAYVVAKTDNGLAATLREHLSDILPDYMVPAAFVRLDTFPLTPNGKLDRQALPVPDQNAFARKVYQAPQGEIETALATIWSELLEVEQIGRYDNFFALGGHSLLAMRMINLAAGRGLMCTLNNLFQFPVLAELVSKITLDPLSQPQSSAIPVRPSGMEPPLFFVPSGMDDYSYIFGLAQHIQSDYPIYALPWPSINEEPVSTIEALAAKMITFMKAVQPEGRYRIYGYSSGGVLAYAIAQQLLNAGETVDFLGLIDTPAPHCFKHLVIQLKFQFLIELARQSGGEHEEEIAVLHQRIDKLNLVQFIAAAQELELYPANLRPDLIAKRWEQMGNYMQMVKEYEPQVLAITLHQFYAMESYPQIPFVTEATLPSLSMEPSLGWKQVVPDSSLQLTSVPGDHFSLMEDSENKTILAKTLSMALAMNCEAEAV
ncbi:non-ribosomal peptide synthetase [Photorhabdus thracensis]|uniref:non-ribosomal peptide synthetase n=11 Tax=Photorhabdus TaxID=29487 RepID=UPI0009E50401|nr:non-ribosomal peptide synthetase [Photorhabdus thracensis]